MNRTLNNIPKGKSLPVNWLNCWFMVLLTMASGLAYANECTIRLAGDSTMQDTNPATHPDFGWGQLLPELTAPGTQVVNYAKGGRSTKTFITEQRWQQLIDQTQSNDWVLIQFGHNDSSYEKPERYTAPVDYQANLERFVADVKNKNAKPILITPVVRRYFDNEGKLKDMHGIYPSLVHKVSEKTQVPLVDLFASSGDYIVALGAEKSKKLFVHIGPNEHPCCAEGRTDDTHFSKLGARTVANLVVKDIVANGPAALAACFTQP